MPCPLPGDLSNPGIEPKSPALQEDSLLSEPEAFWVFIVLSLSIWFKDLKSALSLGRPAPKPAAAWETESFFLHLDLGERTVERYPERIFKALKKQTGFVSVHWLLPHVNGLPAKGSSSQAAVLSSL